MNESKNPASASVQFTGAKPQAKTPQQIADEQEKRLVLVKRRDGLLAQAALVAKELAGLPQGNRSARRKAVRAATLGAGARKRAERARGKEAAS